jgi:hypothetical protein
LEKRGLSDQLRAVGSPPAASIYWSDEMRVGLIGQVRRRWASRGVKVIQQVEYKYEWSYLNLAVNGLTGTLLWAWTKNMQADSIAPVVQTWAEKHLRCLVWDRARGHRGQAYADLDLYRIEQPPYSPELNPAERIFEYLRHKIEGLVYPTIDKKKQAVERELLCLVATPERIKSLAGWHWIRTAVEASR